MMHDPHQQGGQDPAHYGQVEPPILGPRPIPHDHSVLLLGGTTEAFRLAQVLANDAGLDLITAMAGRTSQPRQPAGRLRIGGFGGVEGLANFIVNNRICGLIDATHPFASTISFHAFEAARLTQIPHLLLNRAPWRKVDRDQWIEVPDMPGAAAKIPMGARVLLAVGRQDIAHFAGRQDCWFVSRMMEQPTGPVPRGEVLLERPREDPDQECALIADQRITCLVAKNAGGPGYAKIEAANWMGIPVVMVDRPPLPPAKTASVVGDAAVWARKLLQQMSNHGPI